MVIENEQNLIRLKTQFFTIGAIFITLITFTTMSDIFVKILPLPTWELIIIFIFLFFTILLYRDFLNYNFIYFDDESEKIVLRYYRIRIFERKFKSIEIIKSSFNGYEEKYSFFKQKHDIVLIQKTNKGIAKYPPVSLTSLNKSQKKDLLLSLNKYIKK